MRRLTKLRKRGFGAQELSGSLPRKSTDEVSLGKVSPASSLRSEESIKVLAGMLGPAGSRIPLVRTHTGSSSHQSQSSLVNLDRSQDLSGRIARLKSNNPSFHRTNTKSPTPRSQTPLSDLEKSQELFSSFLGPKGKAMIDEKRTNSPPLGRHWSIKKSPNSSPEAKHAPGSHQSSGESSYIGLASMPGMRSTSSHADQHNYKQENYSPPRSHFGRKNSSPFAEDSPTKTFGEQSSFNQVDLRRQKRKPSHEDTRPLAQQLQRRSGQL